MSRRVGSASAIIAGAMVAAFLVPATSSAASSLPRQIASAPASVAPKQAVAGDWDPGYIVSDENFYDGGAMDVPTVQGFIDSKNPGCVVQYGCLRTYIQPTPSMAASAYCSAIPGAAWESAASIITRVGIACGVSQRALLVILQKEQGLVTATNLSPGKLAAATGMGCPDTAACDPAYGGFFYQVYYAARQYQIYKARPQNFNHRAGAWNNVRLHPSGACGESSVFIWNQATAGLYNYTPYQPNAAALANMYGTGDTCSSYGNRNFWRLWSDWFGSPTILYGLVRQAGSPTVYLQSGSSVFPFASAEVATHYAAIGAVTEVSTATFGVWTVGPPLGQVVQSTDGSRYVVDQGRRYRLIDCAQAFDYSLPCEGVATVRASTLNRLAFAGTLNYTARLPDGSMWLLQDGVRKQFVDPAAFVPFGIPATPSTLSAMALAGTSFGPPAVTKGLFWDGTVGFKLLNSGGVFDASGVGASGWSAFASRLYPESLAQITTTAIMPARIVASGRSFVATPKGWLEVGPGLYGETFTTVPAGSTGSVPAAGKATLPHFVREKSGTQRYFIGGGVRLAVTPEAQATIAATYGLSSTIHVLADGALTGVPERLDSSQLNLVRETGKPQVYLLASGTRYPIASEDVLALFSKLGTVRDLSSADIGQFPVAGNATRAVRAATGAYLLLDKGRRYTFSGCAQAQDFGYTCAALPVLSSAQVAAFPSAGGLNILVRRSDGTTWLMQGGTRRFTPDPTVLAQYGVSMTATQLSDAAIDATPVGAPVLVVGVYGDGTGAVRMVDSSGGIFDVPPEHGRVLPVRVVDATTFAAIAPSRGALALRVESGGRYRVAVTGGWLEVDPTTYGGASLFTTVPANATNGAPVQRVQPLPHFVRESSSTQIYFVGGGVRLAVSAEQAQVIAATYGLDARVWVAADAALEGVPIRVD